VTWLKNVLSLRSDKQRNKMTQLYQYLVTNRINSTIFHLRLLTPTQHQKLFNKRLHVGHATEHKIDKMSYAMFQLRGKWGQEDQKVM
jgi:hypothetical protein